MVRGIEYLLEKDALEEAVLRYLTAVDKLDDLDFMVANFTEDAIFDLTGLDLPYLQGHDQIRAFFAQVFADMTHHMHLLTNFRVVKLEGDQAQIYAYITGLGQAKSGISVEVYVYYDLDLTKVGGTWKISRFYEAPQMPMPDSVAQIHAKG